MFATIEHGPESDATNETIKNKRRDDQELGDGQNEYESCTDCNFEKESNAPDQRRYLHHMAKALILPQRVEPRDLLGHIPGYKRASEVESQRAWEEK